MGSVRFLLEDESVALEVRRHPAVLAVAVAQTLMVTSLAVTAGYLSGPDTTNDPIDLVTGMAATIAWIRLGWITLRWYMTRIVVTDQRILLVSGIASRSVTGIPLARIVDFTYHRPVMGRLLGYGELILEGANVTHGVGRIDHIPDPDHFYRSVVGLLGGPLKATLVTPTDDEDTGPIPRVVV